MDSILRQGPWNIRGSLLLLLLWSPELAIAEIELTLCPFWVQIHGLPCQNMTIKNVVMIRKALGEILGVENLDTSRLLCRQYLRVKVDIDTSQPLKPGFHLPRPNKTSLWISFRYERLGDYCTKCGLIGHKKLGCPHRPELRFPLVQYSIPLQAPSSSGSRLIISGNWEDSNSGLSSDGPSQSRTEVNSSSFHGAESTQLQMIPHLQLIELASHVSTPPQLSSDFGHHRTRVVAHFPMPMNESKLDTLRSCGSVSVWSARDKGKSPVVGTYMPAQPPDPLIFHASDFHPVSFYTSAPLYMNSTITNIQEVSDNPNPAHLAQFTDFLSTWGHSTNPITSCPSPRPFQIMAPL